MYSRYLYVDEMKDKESFVCVDKIQANKKLQNTIKCSWI